MASSASSEFPFHVRLGLLFIVEASCVSAIAVSILLGYLAYYGFNAIGRSRATAPGKASDLAVRRHIRIYFIAMLVADLVQAAGGMLNIKWIAEANVTSGAACTAQSILKEIGDVGVALATLAIAIQTFCIIVLHRQPATSLKVPIIVVSGIWVFIALIIGVSAATHKGKDYWGDTGYWCWITEAYPKQRILLEYLWMWLAGLLNIVLYIPIALTLRGNLSIDGYKIRLGRRDPNKTISQSRRAVNAIAIKMLFYPLIYTLIVLPIAIARWLQFQGHSVSFAATIFSDILFSCSGVFDVLLFRITRPTILRDNEAIDFDIPRLPLAIARNGIEYSPKKRGSGCSLPSDAYQGQVSEIELNSSTLKHEGYQLDIFPDGAA